MKFLINKFKKFYICTAQNKNLQKHRMKAHLLSFKKKYIYYVLFKTFTHVYVSGSYPLPILHSTSSKTPLQIPFPTSCYFFTLNLSPISATHMCISVGHRPLPTNIHNLTENGLSLPQQRSAVNCSSVREGPCQPWPCPSWND